MDLFGTVRVGPEEGSGTPVVVPMEVEVAEKSHREIKLALGYGTEDQFRTQVEWRHLNWLGDGRRLSVSAKYSSITLSGAINFIQPHFLSPRTQANVNISAGGRVGVGRYVGNKTYVTASQELSGEHGRQVGLEYQIAPDWKVGTTTTSTGSNGIDIIWHKRY